MATRPHPAMRTVVVLAAMAALVAILPSAAASQTGGSGPMNSGSACNPYKVYTGQVVEVGSLIPFSVPVDEVRGFLIDHLHGANAYLEGGEAPNSQQGDNGDDGNGGGNNGNHNGHDEDEVRYQYKVFGMLGEYCG